MTRAAERLGVTQPAASAALSRLRRHFGDELLIRDRGEYTLTALGAQLAEQVDAVCAAAERLFAASVDFDPARARKRLVKLCTSRFRGNVMDVAASATTIRVDALSAADADDFTPKRRCIKYGSWPARWTMTGGGQEVNFLPDLVPEPVKMVVCAAGYMADETGLLGHIPGMDGVVVAIGFSGHGSRWLLRPAPSLLI